MKWIICYLTFFASTASANVSLAVFDMEAAIQATSDGQAAKSKLMQEFKFLEGQLKKQEFSLKEKVQDFEKKASILTESTRSQQRRELQELSLQLQKDMQKFQTEMQSKHLAATKPIVEKLQATVARIATMRGLDVVLNKSIHNVLWAQKAIDITDAVVKMYEKAKAP